MGRTFSKNVYCEDCYKLLNYEKGSPRWCVRDHDYCPECEGKRLADEVLKNAFGDAAKKTTESTA